MYPWTLYVAFLALLAAVGLLYIGIVLMRPDDHDADDF